MNTIQARIVGAGVSFVLVFLFGFWVARSGKPYNTLLFTLHKLIALAAAVFLAMAVTQANQAAPLDTLGIIACVVTGVLFLGTIATGGLLSVDRPMPAVVTWLHKITPYLTVLSSAGTLYLLLSRMA